MKRQAVYAHDRCRRRGVSLIEMIIVIMMLATVGLLSATTIQLLFRTDKATTNSVILERTTSRVAQLFRNDVHQSIESAPLDNDGNAGTGLKLIQPNGRRVEYQISGKGVRRQVHQNDALVSQDTFALPRCKLSFPAGTEADSAFRSFVIDRPTTVLAASAGNHHPLRKIVIEARLNSIMVKSETEKLTNTDSQSISEGTEP